MNIAVAIIVFNRPDLTLQLLDVLSRVKPGRVYVISDGPRIDKKNEFDLVQEVRKIIDDKIAWPCLLKKNYSDVNLGCGRRVSSGISWVFENEEEAIILEDDCIPSRSFFRFAAEMLERYRYDRRVMHISGTKLGEYDLGGESYCYSKYPQIWGWATWRRAWNLYDFSGRLWCDSIVRSAIRYDCQVTGDYSFWNSAFRSIVLGRIDTWDHQWILCCWINSGLSITPSSNLIGNRGFRADATHTKIPSVEHVLKEGDIQFPLVSPRYMIVNWDFDVKHAKQFLRGSLLARFKLKIKSIILGQSLDLDSKRLI
jgi:hypothetical protein